MKEDIIDRLNDPEQCIDAIDDAIEEIENLRAVSTPAAGPCLWSWNDDGFWQAACDPTGSGAFYFDSGGPSDNHFKFCPFCGKSLEINTEGL